MGGTGALAWLNRKASSKDSKASKCSMGQNGASFCFCHKQPAKRLFQKTASWVTPNQCDGICATRSLPPRPTPTPSPASKGRCEGSARSVKRSKILEARQRSHDSLGPLTAPVAQTSTLSPAMAPEGEVVPRKKKKLIVYCHKCLGINKPGRWSSQETF